MMSNVLWLSMSNHESIISFGVLLMTRLCINALEYFADRTFSYGYYDFLFQAWPYYRKIMMLERSFLFSNLGLTFVVFKYGWSNMANILNFWSFFLFLASLFSKLVEQA